MPQFRARLAHLSLLLLSACAVGPLVVHESARTVGERNHELTAGYGEAGYVGKWNFGVTKDLDIGLQLESLSLGGRLKYAFINGQDSGWSVAGALGAGTSVGGSHYYGDLMVSHLLADWEPYGVLRIVHIKTDPVDFRDRDSGKLNGRISQYEFNYSQMTVGTRYWFSKEWYASAEASSIFAIEGGGAAGIFLGGAFGYHFY